MNRCVMCKYQAYMFLRACLNARENTSESDYFKIPIRWNMVDKGDIPKTTDKRLLVKDVKTGETTYLRTLDCKLGVVPARKI